MTLGILLAVMSLPALADFEAFVVRDMRVEGLQRISEGTVFNYLPINIGDTIDDIRIGEAIRALYMQGLFDDIEMRRDGDALIIAVKERPSIESFEIEGNKDIKTEDLMESLRGVGLAKGRTFDRSTLDNVAMFMREQYYDRGKYGVQVDTTVEDRPNNTVRIKIDVKEGDRAKIRQVNIVGNTSFDEDEIRDDFNLDTANWLSWLRQDDRYEKQGLEGDLETLRSFYMDRGYANFSIESTQVAISPNKKDIFVTITINEGDKYTIYSSATWWFRRHSLEQWFLPSRVRYLISGYSRNLPNSCRCGSVNRATPTRRSSRFPNSTTKTRQPRLRSTWIRRAVFTSGESTSTVSTRSMTRYCVANFGRWKARISQTS
jgi:outer membrane protein insertion porin family